MARVSLGKKKHGRPKDAWQQKMEDKMKEMEMSQPEESYDENYNLLSIRTSIQIYSVG